MNYWFKAKRYGWGWYPSSWQGWLVLIVYILVFVKWFILVDNHSHSVSDTLASMVFPFILLTGVLIAICLLTGERPRWRWG